MIGVLLVLMLLQYLTRSFIRKGLKKWLEKTEKYWDDIFYKSEFFTQEYSALNPNA
jgi:arsenate reductase-like glutaredoxin family protein